MSDPQPADAPATPADTVTPEHRPPPGATTSMRWAPPGRVTQGQDPLQVTATAGWTVLRREESPAAEVFSVAYTLDGADPGTRPVTFVFNGGPGASSAFLHVGALGPRRIDLPADGALPAMPVRLVDNDACWLPWTDLVFVDPVGTGFSRPVPPSPDRTSDRSADRPTNRPPANTESTTGPPGPPVADDPGYYSFASDLAALREFVSRWLSANGRWASPVWLAGESYGGYRIGRLARSLPVEEGVGLAGVVLISPAMELAPLTMTDYSVEGFLDVVPTMAAAALHHGRIRGVEEGTAADQVMTNAAEFAASDYVAFLAQGAAMDPERRQAVLTRLADLTGLDPDLVQRLHGRVPIERFARELLRDAQQVVGLYDATQTVVDPYPDREPYGGAEHTLDGMTAAFTMGVNQVVRGQIGVTTDRRYHLISMAVNTAWRADTDSHALESPGGATDDLRYGLAVNPHLQVLVVHGRHDLVTPLHTSTRLVNQMRLDPSAVDRVRLRAYDGGHMFYTLAGSRDAFTADVAALYAAVATPAT